MKGLQQLKTLAGEEKKDPTTIPAICDTQATSFKMTVNSVGTITKARGYSRALFSMQHGTPLTVSELLRLQGFQPGQMRFNDMSSNQMGGLVGNAMTRTILQCLIVNVIKGIQLVAKRAS